MRKVEKFYADDDVEEARPFNTEEECREYEHHLPILKFMQEIEVRVAENPDFADRIEKLGARLAKERRERGELKRARKGEGASANQDASAP